MDAKRLLLRAAVVLLAAAPTFAQENETTHSYGTFKIKVNSTFSSQFTNCPAQFWDGTNFVTPNPLYDPNTSIGVSAVTTSPAPVPVGTPSVMVGGNILSGVGPADQRVYTNIRSLNMTGDGITVQLAPAPPSNGEVSPSPTNATPARSEFKVFVQITLPPCPSPATFPGAQLYNRSNEPLIVKADNLTALPPIGIVYMHDQTSVVPIRFLNDNPGHWRSGQILGCIVFAGHGIESTDVGEEAGRGKFKGKIPPGLEKKFTAAGCPRPGGGPSLTTIAVLGGLTTAWIVVAWIRRRREDEEVEQLG